MSERTKYDAWHSDGQDHTEIVEPYDSLVYYDAPYPPEPPRRRGAWIPPTLVVLALLVAFAMAWFFTRSGGNDNAGAPTQNVLTSGPSSPEASQESAPEPTQESTETSEAPQSSETFETSESTSPESVPTTEPSQSGAGFPPQATPTCGDGQPLTSDNVRLDPGTNSSCGYVEDAVAKVNERLGSDPAAIRFMIYPYSTELKRTIPLTCERSNHLSYCHGGRNVRFWVADSVQ